MIVYGDHEENVLDQLRRCADVEGARAVLCADAHLGYSMPIGGVVAYRDHISPSGVGYDIGCGNKAVRVNVPVRLLNVKGAMDEIVRRISFGIGRANDRPVDHPVLDQIRDAADGFQRGLLDLAAKQLGTVGSGNHYVDLFEDEEGWLWIGVHFGSRGFGHKTATRYLELAGGRDGMDAPPTLIPIDSDLGQSYEEAMRLAGAYAYAGRDVVVDEIVRGILGTTVLEEVHNHHNYAWRENLDGEEYIVVRKGSTPARPGERAFVGGSMGDHSVILEGTERAAECLYSTAHGAGRALSRTAAAGKFKRSKWAVCRPCKYAVPLKDAGNGCPDCGNRLAREERREQVRPGIVDWDAWQKRLREQGIELRGGGADEAPEAYKRLDEVLAFHGDTIKIIHRLRPIGVAMAGPETVDPYKD